MYVKLFRDILTSSIWMEDNETLRVFLTFLLLCDQEGLVECSVPGIAKEAGVSLDDAKRSISKLESPDPESRTKTEDGRRILRLSDDGTPIWFVVNYEKFRGIRDEEQRREYKRNWMRAHRARLKDKVTSSVDKKSRGGYKVDRCGPKKKEMEMEREIEVANATSKYGDGAGPSPVLDLVLAPPGDPPAPDPPEKAPKAKKVQAHTSSVPERPDYTPQFEAFWSLTWRRGNKMKAFEVYQGLEAADREACDAAVHGWTKAYGRREASIRPHITTWLNRRGWEDDLEAELERGRDPMKDKRFKGGISPDLGW